MPVPDGMKVVRAKIKVLGEPWAEEWGVDVEMNDESVIFDQMFKKVRYEKSDIKGMKLRYSKGHGLDDF